MLRAFLQADVLEAGCDEAGRGCLAGPVFAAAVIMPKHFRHPLLNDSKQMSEAQREEARLIIEQHALAWAVASASPREIDRVNILNASFLAMHRAIRQLDPTPESLLIDGNRFQAYGDLPFHCIIKGDGKLIPIAAASILAKTYRDACMKDLAADFPHYGWESNKGYPTAGHRAAIARHGPCPHHRRSFRLVKGPVQGDLFGS